MSNEFRGQPPQELETFLPNKNGTSTYKVVPATKKDVETAALPEFDPFKERNLKHPTTDHDTLMHLLKASLGTGILAMPVAFSYVGLINGIFSTIVTALICTHCAYILVKCAHVLYRRTRRTAMTFSEVAEVALNNGPTWCRGWGKTLAFIIDFGLFLTYFGTCAVYTVIISRHFKQVVNHYFQLDEYDVQYYIAALLIPLILLSWLPNLKFLAPVSMLSNVFMAISLGITMWYLVTGLPEISERELFKSPLGFPPSFAIIIFAMEAIGVVMPLENHMKTPQNFVGFCGVLNQGMSGVTLIYILLGYLGYWKYGDQAEGSITLNLPIDEVAGQICKVLIGLAVFGTFGLQFYVCLEIGWNTIKDHFTTRPTLVNYVMRTVLVTAAVLLAIAVPTISPFIGLIGAFFFSILGLIIPIFIEMVIDWDEGFGKYYWVIWKNIICLTFGIIALIFGSMDSIKEILDLYVH
jgi:proton-coupled amino acid transporter